MFKVGLTGSIACGKSFVAKLFMVYNVPIIDSDIIAREVVSPLYEKSVLPELVKSFGEEIKLPNGELNRALLRSIVFSDKSKLSTLNAITHPAIKERSNELLALLEKGEAFPKSYTTIQHERLFANKNPAQNTQGGAKNADKALSAQSCSNLDYAKSANSSLNVIDESQSEAAVEAFSQPLRQDAVISSKVAPYVIIDIPLLFENNLESTVDRILLVTADAHTQIARLMLRDNCNREDAMRIISAQYSVDKKRALSHDIIETDVSSIAEKRQHVLNLHDKYVKMGLCYKA